MKIPTAETIGSEVKSAALIGGKHLLYSQTDLDRKAATTLSKVESSASRLTRFAKLLGGLSSEALDIAQPAREEKRTIKSTLRRRLGRFVLVGSFMEDDQNQFNEDQVNYSANRLVAEGLISKGTIVGVRPILLPNEARPNKDLLNTAESVHRALTDKHDITTILIEPTDPARIPGKRSGSKPDALYGTLSRSHGEFHAWVEDRLSERGVSSTSSLHMRELFVVNNNVAEYCTGSIRPQDLENGGMAVLKGDERAANFYWQALPQLKEITTGAAFDFIKLEKQLLGDQRSEPTESEVAEYERAPRFQRPSTVPLHSHD